MTSFLPVKPALHHSPATPSGRTGYLLPHLIGAITSITSICSACQGTLCGRAATHGCPSSSSAQTVPKAKKAASFPRATGEHVYRWDCPKGLCRKDHLVPRGKRPLPGSLHLKPSHAEAFLLDSSIMKEARLCFFSNHSYNFIDDGTCDLSDVFKELAESTGLLGEAIYEIQLSWTRPEKLKQANYALQSLPKGLRFLRVVPTSESPKVMGAYGHP